MASKRSSPYLATTPRRPSLAPRRKHKLLRQVYEPFDHAQQSLQAIVQALAESHEEEEGFDPQKLGYRIEQVMHGPH